MNFLDFLFFIKWAAKASMCKDESKKKLLKTELAKAKKEINFFTANVVKKTTLHQEMLSYLIHKQFIIIQILMHFKCNLE